MRLLFLGDVIGRNARDEIIAQLPGLRTKYNLDAVIVNGENAAHGFGITAQICTDLYNAGIAYIGGDPKLLRPLNFPEGTPGKGSYIIQTKRGHKILVANVMGRLFMDALDDPFAAIDKLCRANRLGKDVNAIVVDIHAEAGSEKMGMGHFCDGRVSFVVGTHTHVPTADAQILPKGTGYQTDAGMCGSFNSVIGMDASISVNRWTRKMPGEKHRPAEGPVTLCGAMVDIDPGTGLCTRIQPFRLGGRLLEALPEVS
jgi:metallophosphoesterase (TIGR00282 family)